jgi:hypothetical protein
MFAATVPAPTRFGPSSAFAETALHRSPDERRELCRSLQTAGSGHIANRLTSAAGCSLRPLIRSSGVLHPHGRLRIMDLGAHVGA